MVNQGVHDRVSTSVETSTIIQKCQSIREGEEYLNSFGRKLAKMNEKDKLMTILGLHNPFPSNSSPKFIRMETYKKDLESKMSSKVVKFPQDTTPKCIVNCIKSVENLNLLLDVALISSKSSKYGSLTKLKAFYYNITNVQTPNKAEFNILKKMIESSIVS